MENRIGHFKQDDMATLGPFKRGIQRLFFREFWDNIGVILGNYSGFYGTLAGNRVGTL